MASTQRHSSPERAAATRAFSSFSGHHVDVDGGHSCAGAVVLCSGCPTDRSHRAAHGGESGVLAPPAAPSSLSKALRGLKLHPRAHAQTPLSTTTAENRRTISFCMASLVNGHVNLLFRISPRALYTCVMWPCPDRFEGRGIVE